MNKKIVLQEFERHGKFGVFFYGEEDSDPKTWEKRVVVYRKPVVRSRKECMEEQKRMLRLGVYEDQFDSDNVVMH